MVALYLLALGIAAGTTGVFGHHLLDSQGFMPAGFQMELVLVAGMAAAYAMSQLLYVAVVRFVYPSRSPALISGEIASQLAALFLAPYLLNVHVHWPHPMLDKVEPLLYLGAFALGHLFFKLVSFYGAVQGAPAGRGRALGWFAGAAIAAAGVLTVGQAVVGAGFEEPVAAPADVQWCRVGDAYAPARRVPEGAVLIHDLEDRPNPCLTLRLAAPPDAGEDETLPGTVYVSAVIEGSVTTRHAESVELDPNGWAEFHVPATAFPPSPTRCTFAWSAESEPSWRILALLQPRAASGRTLLVSGPFAHMWRRNAHPPSVILLAIEGLGSDRVSAFGYERQTTPTLDRLSHLSACFANAYTAAPDAPAACMTLLTGRSPLTHGFLGDAAGPLPLECRTLAERLGNRYYTTACFTEEDRRSALAARGFERGFDLVIRTLPGSLQGEQAADGMPPTPDSRISLNEAASWIEAHTDHPFFVFVWLRELSEPTDQKRYAAAFEGASNTYADRYDRALHYVDGEIGEFLRRLRATKVLDTTYTIVTSLYGLDFSAGRSAPPQRLLSESCLRVPLLFSGPGIRSEQRAGFIALEDVMPSVLEAVARTETPVAGVAAAVGHAADEPLAETDSGCPLDGVSFLVPPSTKEPVSMMGKPLVLSLRSDLWRFTWRSNQRPFAARTRTPGQVVELYDVRAAEARGLRRNDADRHTDLVQGYTAQLEGYLDAHCAPPAGDP